MNDVGAFVQRVIQRPLPSDSMGRIRTLAKELAEGAAEGLWEIAIAYETTETDTFGGYKYISNAFKSGSVNFYLAQRWNNSFPDFRLLEVNGLIGRSAGGIYLEKAAFDLIAETEPVSAFISYRRMVSSAFAMFILTRLKMAGLDAYLDLAIPAGDDWESRIKSEVTKRDYFVLLVGEGTLESAVLQKEITWAVESGATIIPIWHPGFTFESGKDDVPDNINEVLRTRNAIRVFDESALGYHTALVALLNRFGIAPD